MSDLKGHFLPRNKCDDKAVTTRGWRSPFVKAQVPVGELHEQGPLQDLLGGLVLDQVHDHMLQPVVALGGRVLLSEPQQASVLYLDGLRERGRDRERERERERERDRERERGKQKERERGRQKKRENPYLWSGDTLLARRPSFSLWTLWKERGNPCLFDNIVLMSSNLSYRLLNSSSFYMCYHGSSEVNLKDVQLHIREWDFFGKTISTV